MRERSLSLALVLAVGALAAVVLLAVNFRLKQRHLEAGASGVPSPAASAPGPAAPGPRATPGPGSGPQAAWSPESAPSARPTVDGRITEGEYRFRYFDPEIHASLYWTIDTEAVVIYLGLVSPARGWVAISFAPTGPRMRGGDILIGYVKDGQVFVRDDYAHEVVSHSADVELTPKGEDNILASAGSSGPVGTVLEIVRPLQASDAYDKPIAEGPMRVQLAYSEVADFSSYHLARTTLQINFYTGEVSRAPSGPP